MQNLNKILDKALQYLEKSEGFLSEQIPEFCKQLMEYHAWSLQWEHDVAFWFTAFFFILSLILFVIGMIKDEVQHYVGGALTGIVFIVAFCTTVSTYQSLKMYEIAPKVFLVKTIKDMAVKR